jgi:hypothetical protein
MAFAAKCLLVANRLIRMARQVFEEEAGLYDSALLTSGEMDSADSPPLEDLPDPRVILFKIGQALVAALGAGVFLCALLQWSGVG